MTGEVGENSKLSTTMVLTAGLLSAMLVVFVTCMAVLSNFTDKQVNSISTLGYQTVSRLAANPNGVSGPVIYKAVVESNGAVNHVYLDGSLLYSLTDGSFVNLMMLTTKYANKSYICECRPSGAGAYIIDLYLTEVIQ